MTIGISPTVPAIDADRDDLRIALGRLTDHVYAKSRIEQAHERKALTVVDRIAAPGVLLHVLTTGLGERGLVADLGAGTEDDVERVLSGGIERGPGALCGGVQRLVQAVADRVLREIARRLDYVRQGAHVLDRHLRMHFNVDVTELSTLEHDLLRLAGRDPACFVGIDASGAETRSDCEHSCTGGEVSGLHHTLSLLWCWSGSRECESAPIIDPVHRDLFGATYSVAVLLQTGY